MQSLTEKSPLGTLIEHLKKGELAYQVTEDGKAIYYPRAVAPVTGGKLEWRVSKGLGTVYSTTTVHPQQGTPYNVALIDVDEGFRLMSRVEDISPTAVRIGMRVKFCVHPAEGDESPYPVFTPAEGA